MKVLGTHIPLAGLWLIAAGSCTERPGGQDFTTVAGDSTQEKQSICSELGMVVSAPGGISPSANGCTLALRAFFALASDTATLQVLGPQSLAVDAAEIEELREQEIGSSSIRRVTAVTLRLPKASYDVQVRFGTDGDAIYVSTIHKPLQ